MALFAISITVCKSLSLRIYSGKCLLLKRLRLDVSFGTVCEDREGMTPIRGVENSRARSHDEDSTMTRTILTVAAAISLTFSSSASANDIVDFLRAVSGPSPSYRGHERQVSRYTPTRGNDRYRSRTRYTQTRRPIVASRPGVSFSVSFGNTAPQPRPVYAPQPVLEVPPAPGSFEHLPHQIGEIVTCDVALEPHVVIKDACEVAPNAVPVVIAVRNPHLGRYRSRGCVESLVYVEVLVPPCPPQRVRVSACKTRVRLDFGQYEVDITSRNGRVEIDYDN